jgi:hypothetical protein
LATNSINSIFASNKFIENELYKINQQQSAQNTQLIFVNPSLYWSEPNHGSKQASKRV